MKNRRLLLVVCSIGLVILACGPAMEFSLGPTSTPVVVALTVVVERVVTATPVTPTPPPTRVAQPVVAEPTASATAVPSTAAPTASATPSSFVYGAPALFDPPNGKSFAAKNTILRWKFEQELKPDEVFDVLVWPENGVKETSIGSTKEKILPIDFMTWEYAGTYGKYLWNVRIKRQNGAYLSGPSEPLFFIIGQWFPSSDGLVPLGPKPAPYSP